MNAIDKDIQRHTAIDVREDDFSDVIILYTFLALQSVSACTFSLDQDDESLTLRGRQPFLKRPHTSRLEFDMI